MRIVVNHLTRMQPGYICVAGIDPATRQHVRPVLESGRLSTGLLRRNRGPFDIGAVVDLGATTPVGRPPEMEDVRFNQWKAAWVQDAVPDRFWRALQLVTRPHLVDLFGPDLETHERTCTLPVGRGLASLGCLPVAGPILGLDSYDKIRLSFTDGLYGPSLPVTDLRLYEPDGVTPRRELVAGLARRLDAGVPVILSLGLTRPYLKPGDTVSRHWLQVNTSTWPTIRCGRTVLSRD